MNPAWKFILLATSLALLSASGARGQSSNVLQILGMFPDPTADSSVLWPEGYWCIPAVQLAIDHINNHSILEGYHLELQTATSGCRRNPAVMAYIQNVVTPRAQAPPIAIVGPGCSSSALPVASLISASPTKIVQVSYGATSPSLSNVKAFPHFFRTVMPNSQLSRTMALLLNHLKWSNIATLYEDNSILHSTALSLHGWLGSDLLKNGRVLHSSLVTSSTIKFELEQIRDSNGRIVFAFAFPNTAAEILCRAFQLGMIYPRYVWIFPEHYRPFWNTSAGGCTAEELQIAATGTLGFTFQTVTTETDKELVSGINFTTFDAQYSTALSSFVQEYNSGVSAEMKASPPSPFSQFYRTAAYDAVWALALALNRTEQTLKDIHTLSLANYSQQQNLVYDILQQNLEKIEFQGASGYVQIQNQHFSYLPVFFYQAQANDAGQVVYKKIGSQIFTAEDPGGTDPLFESDFIWNDNPPSDEFNIVTINPAGIPAASIVIVFVMIIFLLNSLSMFVNYFYRFNPALKTSSPSLNWFIFGGHYLILLGVVLYSVLMLDPEVCNVSYAVLCNLLPWTISIGYTVVIATITVKCFRIYMIFHQATTVNSGQRFKWILRDSSLMFLIIGIIAIDVLLLVAWGAAAPITRFMQTQVDVVNGIEEQILSCHLGGNSSAGFIGAIIVWKFILSISVTFFAWEMRSITIRDFDNGGTSFTFLLANLVLTLVSIIVVFFLVSNDVASTVPVYVFIIVSVAMLLFICLSLGILLGFKQRRLVSKDDDGKYLFFSTFTTRGALLEEHRNSIASRSTYGSHLSEHFTSISERAGSLEPDGKSTPTTPSSVGSPKQYFPPPS